MKKFLLLPLVAVGLVAWVPSQAEAGVHVTFGFGVPAYYGPYYGYYAPYYGGYYPGHSYYYYPHRHHYYHHRYWHRW